VSVKRPTTDELDRRYTYIPPKANEEEKCGILYKEVRKLARFIVLNTPVSEEQVRALNHLDIVLFLANAAITRNVD